ncbi:MAG: transporter substrate-binding domain-containing protein [Prolixibacteraceae bacterium]|nr:transporter substrate-binding domain-containing protein [Burkholderiales bacterium]
MRKLFAWYGLTFLLALTSVGVWAQTDPDEIADTLERSKAKGKLLACADPYSFPSAAQNTDPPGYDIEIMREIATRGGMRLEMVWADTGTRGGTSRAFRNSILKKRCDVFLGMSDSGDDDMLMGELAFTKPYVGMGYVLVVQGKAADKKTLSELKDANITVGVPMSTPIDDYLFTNNIPRSLFLDNRRIMQAMSKGEIDASLVWVTAIAVARREYPNAKFHMVEGYVPEADQRWNLNFIVRKQDQSLMKFIDDTVAELLANGKMKQILETYNVPFYPPFS